MSNHNPAYEAHGEVYQPKYEYPVTHPAHQAFVWRLTLNLIISSNSKSYSQAQLQLVSRLSGQ